MILIFVIVTISCQELNPPNRIDSSISFASLIPNLQTGPLDATFNVSPAPTNLHLESENSSFQWSP